MFFILISFESIYFFEEKSSTSKFQIKFSWYWIKWMYNLLPSSFYWLHALNWIEVLLLCSKCRCCLYERNSGKQCKRWKMYENFIQINIYLFIEWKKSFQLSFFSKLHAEIPSVTFSFTFLNWFIHFYFIFFHCVMRELGNFHVYLTISNIYSEKKENLFKIHSFFYLQFNNKKLFSVQ